MREVSRRLDCYLTERQILAQSPTFRIMADEEHHRESYRRYCDFDRRLNKLLFWKGFWRGAALRPFRVVKW